MNISTGVEETPAPLTTLTDDIFNGNYKHYFTIFINDHV